MITREQARIAKAKALDECHFTFCETGFIERLANGDHRVILLADPVVKSLDVPREVDGVKIIYKNYGYGKFIEVNDDERDLMEEDEAFQAAWSKGIHEG